MNKEKKLVIWGIGNFGKKLIYSIDAYGKNKYKIVALIDKNYEIEKEIGGYEVFAPSEITKVQYDEIVIASNKYFNEIEKQLTDEFKVDKEKIRTFSEVYDPIIKKEIEKKYRTSPDVEIKKIISYWKENKISIFNHRENKECMYYEVMYDKEKDAPYIYFEGKKMYYPKEYDYFIEKNGKLYLKNVLEAEQYEGSPHLYISGNHKINKGDVVVDAGAAEGNFSLRYIDLISKLYIIECDSKWMKALKMTFEPYNEKVVFVEKKLSDMVGEDSITLDDLLNCEKEINFIKMDIESAETSALIGGIDILKRSNAKLSICAYHRTYDEKNIRFILESLGYNVSTSEGYMYFFYDEQIERTLDFRHGVVYGYR